MLLSVYVHFLSVLPLMAINQSQIYACLASDFLIMKTPFPSSSPPWISPFSSLFCLTVLVAALSSTKPERIAVKLIHRYSISNDNYDEIDRSSRVSRALNFWPSYFQQQLDVEANLLPSSSFLFIGFSIGRPPTPQLAVMDTGSSLIWVQCASRRIGSDQNAKKFDPSKSSTYKPLPCDDPICNSTSSLFNKCDQSLTQCTYSQNYLSGPSSRGLVAAENLIFSSADEGVSTVSDVIFGCGNENRQFGSDPQITGIFGLGYRKWSIVGRFGNKFSYCIGDVTDPNYAHNVLILGGGAFFQGDSTPLEVVQSHYHLSLRGISVGDKRLDINTDMFLRKNTGNRLSGVVLDSGSPLTWLVREAFEAVLAEVKELLDKWLRPVLSRRPREVLCYEGNMNLDLAGFPVVTFHFAADADLILDTNSLFVQISSDEFCFAFRPSRLPSLTIIGLLAQQFYNFAFDLEMNLLFFQRIDCELLED